MKCIYRPWNKILTASLMATGVIIAAGQGCSSPFELKSPTFDLPSSAVNTEPPLINTETPINKTAIEIIQAKCVGCHKAGGQAAFANFDFSTAEEFFKTPWFKPGDISSPAIVRMKGSGANNATMPTDSSDWTLTEFNTIKEWILNAVASNPSNPSAPRFEAQFACTIPSAPAASSIQRLAKIHYLNSLSEFMSRVPASVRQEFIDQQKNKIEIWPDDTHAEFSYMNDDLTQAHVGSSLDIAMGLATSLVSNSTAINAMMSVCGNGSTKANLTQLSCLQNFVNYYGRKTFRRPITTAEQTDFISYYNRFAGDEKIVALLARFLSHPRFLYRLDNEGTYVSGQEGVDAIYQLSKYELLSKMTFLYWQAPPDDQLYTFVQDLDLNQDMQLNRVLDQIIANPKSRQGVLHFYSEWLRLQRTPLLDTDSKAFLTLAGEDISTLSKTQYRQDMINEVLDMAQYYTLAVEGRYEDLMTSPYSFARSQTLAKIYGVSTWNGTTSGLVRFPSADRRAGILTRAAFLSANSEYTRPIVKGKRIRVDILCDEIPPTPPGLVVDPLIQELHLTTAQVVTRTTGSNTCMTCHSQMNPLGFASENFDSLGRARSIESKFDSSGRFIASLPVNTKVTPQVFTEDTREIDGIAELEDYIAQTGKGQQCMVRKFFRYSQGRMENLVADGCALENMRKQMTMDNGSLLKMFKETSRQLTFRQRRVK